MWFQVARVFPIISRLAHIFRCPDLAENMVWHSKNRSMDGIVRLPMDLEARRHIEATWPDFAIDPRNLTFGMATDGFSPHGRFGSQYSMWPVMLVNYNIPPWDAIKKGEYYLGCCDSRYIYFI